MFRVRQSFSSATGLENVVKRLAAFFPSAPVPKLASVPVMANHHARLGNITESISRRRRRRRRNRLEVTPGTAGRGNWF